MGRGKWETFFFDDGIVLGPIASREVWLGVWEVYKKYRPDTNIADLLEAKISSNLEKGMLDFGFSKNHRGTMTLGEWAHRKGMNLKPKEKKVSLVVLTVLRFFVVILFGLLVSFFWTSFNGDLSNFEYVFIGATLFMFGVYFFSLRKKQIHQIKDA